MIGLAIPKLDRPYFGQLAAFDGAGDDVAMANEQGVRAATAHLVQRGSRRIAWVSQAGSGEKTSNAVWLRGEGYRRALADAEHEPDRAL